MLSVIVPAFNEANQIGAVVASARRSADLLGLEHEIIVVDDDSWDDTAALAAAAGALVHPVRKRQIAAVRNAGAAVARFETLVFLDGDTVLNPSTLDAAISALDHGAAGGGALCTFDAAGRVARLAMWLGTRGMALAHRCGGCFLFVRRATFRQVGGFDERLFAGEDLAFARAVSQHGPFKILRPPVVTSGRKVRRESVAHLLAVVARLAWRGPSAVESRDGLELWYDGRREPRPGSTSSPP